MSLRSPYVLQTPQCYNLADGWRYGTQKRMAGGMSSEGRQYISYLLRLWRTKSGDETVWRASLEDSETGERRGFANLDALLAFLRQQTDLAQGAQVAPEPGGDRGEADGQSRMTEGR